MQDIVHSEHLEADHWWFRARRSIFARLLRDLAKEPAYPEGSPPRSTRVLDLGPGSGVNLPVLTDRGAVVVLDSSARSLASCRGQGALGLVRGNAMQPPFGDGSFDLVCALDVLEHLEDDAAALAECRRMLRPDGCLFVSVPALGMLWGRQDVLAEHHRRYQKAELRTRLEEAGFLVERLSFFNTLLFPPILVVRLLMRPFLHWTRRGRSDLSVRMPLGLDAVFFRLFASEGAWLARRDLPIGVSLLAIARPIPPDEGPSSRVPPDMEPS